jgi:D-arabinose 1-dehydrogenase-like Zn-dependent alcohol dehydrogenase
MGHQVSAFSLSPEKKEIIDRLGAEYVDSSSLNSLKRHNRQFDFILSTLNVCFDLDPYLKMLKPQGKLCLVAQPNIGSRSDTIAMLAFSAKNNIQSDAVIMPFSRIC